MENSSILFCPVCRNTIVIHVPSLTITARHANLKGGLSLALRRLFPSIRLIKYGFFSPYERTSFFNNCIYFEAGRMTAVLHFSILEYENREVYKIRHVCPNKEGFVSPSEYTAAIEAKHTESSRINLNLLDFVLFRHTRRPINEQSGRISLEEIAKRVPVSVASFLGGAHIVGPPSVRPIFLGGFYRIVEFPHRHKLAFYIGAPSLPRIFAHNTWLASQALPSVNGKNCQDVWIHPESIETYVRPEDAVWEDYPSTTLYPHS